MFIPRNGQRVIQNRDNKKKWDSREYQHAKQTAPENPAALPNTRVKRIPSKYHSYLSKVNIKKLPLD